MIITKYKKKMVKNECIRVNLFILGVIEICYHFAYMSVLFVTNLLKVHNLIY